LLGTPNRAKDHAERDGRFLLDQDVASFLLLLFVLLRRSATQHNATCERTLDRTTNDNDGRRTTDGSVPHLPAAQQTQSVPPPDIHRWRPTQGEASLPINQPNTPCGSVALQLPTT
jgi:hypothetical protein